MGALTTRPPSLGVHRRAAEVPQVDPRTHDPNANPPIGTVGPQSVAGDLILGPADLVAAQHAEAWAGWPGAGWGTPPMEDFGGEWSGYGYGRQNREGYLGRVSTVMTCTDLTSKQLASMPIYGHVNDAPFVLPDWRKTPQPEVYDSWPTFVKTLVNSMILRGEAILWATSRYANGYPATFVVVNADFVEFEANGRGGWDLFLGDQRLDPADVLQIKYQSIASRARGLGPLEWAAGDVTDARILNAYASNIARFGVSAVLTHPNNLTAKQSADLKAAFMASRSIKGAPAVLSGGITYEAISMSPRDMALVDLLHMNEQRIAAAIGVPPILAGLPQPGGSLTYSSVNMLTDFWWRSALRPLAQQIASSLSRWLLPGDRVIEFDRDEFTRPDMATLAQYYSTLHSVADGDGNPAITVDEIRIAERLAPWQPPAEVGTVARLTNG
jgi:HK97 family phage portal protein